VRGQRLAQGRLARGVGHRHNVDAELRGLRRQRHDVSPACSQRRDAEPVAVAAYDVERLDPDGPGAAEDHDVAHAPSVTDERRSSLLRSGEPTT
jgi:hypothetical protein